MCAQILLMKRKNSVSDTRDTKNGRGREWILVKSYNPCLDGNTKKLSEMYESCLYIFLFKFVLPMPSCKKNSSNLAKFIYHGNSVTLIRKIKNAVDLNDSFLHTGSVEDNSLAMGCDKKKKKKIQKNRCDKSVIFCMLLHIFETQSRKLKAKRRKSEAVSSLKLF
jgi:hypothetical protein